MIQCSYSTHTTKCMKGYNMSETKERFWSVSELAEHLDVHVRTLHVWITNRHFPHARKRGPGITSPWAIPDSDVQAFKASLAPVWTQAPTDGAEDPA